MPWRKSSVPKFGNWEKSEDLSYSIIFDKARAEKEMFLHVPDRNSNDFSSDRSSYKNSNVEAGKKAPFLNKARADGERFLPTSEQDKMFRHMHQNSELTAGRGVLHASYAKSSGLRTRIFGYTGPKSPSGARTLQDQQNSIDIQEDPWNHSDAPAFNTLHPSGAPTRQPLQVGATKETSFFNGRQHVHKADRGFHGKLHANSTNTPGRATYAENPPFAKIRSSQGGIETSRIAAMQRKHAVPKFGDWDSGDGFSAAFNEVRNETSSKYALRPGAKAVSPSQPDEDLYKSSEISEALAVRKKHRGWFQMICCSKAVPHTNHL